MNKLYQLGIACLLGLVGCAGDAGFQPAPSSVAGDATAAAAAPAEAMKRSGIATGWGRELSSEMNFGDFKRSSAKPYGVATIRYNDEEGAKAMGVNLSNRRSGMQAAAGGLVEWGMATKWSALPNYWWQGERFAVGKKGSEYELRVKNLADVRVEVVLSVDGLDVMDGKVASVGKRGYLIDPKKTLVVKGFRTGYDTVASFRFSSVQSSYSNLRHGDTRNVGVVGLAVFTQAGNEPWSERKRRAGAQAFAEAP